jgi:hypothetical protein
MCRPIATTSQSAGRSASCPREAFWHQTGQFSQSIVERKTLHMPSFKGSLLKTLGKRKVPETVTYQMHHRMGSGGKEGGRR